MATPLPGPGRPVATPDPDGLAEEVRAALAGLSAGTGRGTDTDLDEQVRTLEELHRRLAAALTTIDTV